MASNFWVVFALVATCAIITDGVVKIIKASKSGNSKEGAQKIEELEADFESLEADLDDAKNRIEVLEKIVTEEKYNLGKKIDEL
ncbi:MAG: hypothetical protein CMQ20_11515 [Gammaproteobacteria bacterium]|jgi:hypothetical protein|nr:hypothetical protein [Gammaproteobacteria bacterium]|tara:strand:- start:665 stop:916 length:252 start_codon:yes stop_codon:yes gene_type:complete